MLRKTKKNGIFHKVYHREKLCRGFDPSLRKLSTKELGIPRIVKPIFESWGEIFGTFFFHFSNFERILGSKRGYAHGTYYF